MNAAPKPKTLLGRHRVLSPSAGIKVSPLCLGAMNFGDSWKSFMGECSKETSFAMLDYFKAAGGNFIDTAGNYQDQESEMWIGEWMAKHGNRDQMVIATKYTTNFQLRHGHDNFIQSNFGGNNAKTLRLGVEASLKNLQTSYIDILYLHWWDFSTSIEEIMLSLNDMVKAGKVLYLGISDTPAWIVSKANQYARDNGLHRFVVYQGRWSAADRDFERDILPMCADEGMAMAPWGALGGGQFKTEAQHAASKGEGRMTGPSDKHAKVATVLEQVGKRHDTAITSVALAYVMHKAPYVFPIVGGRKIEHLKGNIEALGLQLTLEDIEEIEAAVEFDVGFPLNMLGGSIGSKGHLKGPGDSWLTGLSGVFDYVDLPTPISPAEVVKKQSS